MPDFVILGQGNRTRLPSPVVEQTSLLGQPEPLRQPHGLTPRQQHAYEALRHAGRDGLTADELGQQLHAHAGKHDADQTCVWCPVSGREVARALRRKGLIRSRRDGHWYALQPVADPQPEPDPWPEGF